MAEDLGLDLERHRDLRGRDREPWIRRSGMALLTLVPLAALLNTFGQAPTTATAEGSGVELRVTAPEAVRGGLYFQVQIDVETSRRIEDPTIVLSPSWLEGLTLNTIEPAPSEEEWGRDGLILHFPPMEAGGELAFFLQYQVNPITVERRDQRVQLRDGETVLATIDRTFAVYP